MGRDYAQGRNFDRGLGAHRDVSMLSAYIRRRLITEQEVIATAIKAHGAEASAKFIDEVIWRSYFKGWLEQRPEVWDSYAGGLWQDLAELGADAGLRHAVQAAEAAQTGLAYFDSWAAELVVEPSSKRRITKLSTCLFFDWIFDTTSDKDTQ